MKITNLKKLIDSNILVIGIGNTLKGDDGVGTAVIKNLKLKMKNEMIKLLDVGAVPENYTKEIRELKPATIILIDAVEMDEKPGIIKIIDEKEITAGYFTTHNIPLNLFIDYVKEQTKAKIIFIGIQPKSTKFGEPLSAPVKNAVTKLVGFLCTS
ncbi:MAG: hydrogenase maturation peptidase HycI [Elusimicrobiota bacterium]